MDFRFEAIAENQPGAKWRARFEHHWPSYRQWFLREGERARPSRSTCERAILEHMPELMPVYERLVRLAGNGDLEARFLSMWCPPAYVGGCSQLIVPGRRPALIRNYDYSPKLLEGTWLASRMISRRVVGMADCLWGLLDGINEDGLAVSLAFGGRRVMGEGFGIPLILRYVLECAATTREAARLFARVPVHMPYTIAMVDRTGRHATMFLNPDRKAERTRRLASANHQHRVEWPRHAAATRSVEREAALRLVARRARPGDQARAFLKPPLYQSNYELGYGTLYTAHYRTEDASATLSWPELDWRQSCAEFRDGLRIVEFGDESSPGFRVPKYGVV